MYILNILSKLMSLYIKIKRELHQFIVRTWEMTKLRHSNFQGQYSLIMLGVGYPDNLHTLSYHTHITTIELRNKELCYHLLYFTSKPGFSTWKVAMWTKI